MAAVFLMTLTIGFESHECAGIHLHFPLLTFCRKLNNYDRKNRKLISNCVPFMVADWVPCKVFRSNVVPIGAIAATSTAFDRIAVAVAAVINRIKAHADEVAVAVEATIHAIIPVTTTIIYIPPLNLIDLIK